MLEVNNYMIMEDELTILEELKKQLHINGINRFAKFVLTTNNIQTNCPFHKDGQERKPSFGILTRAKRNQPAGTCHCLACGWTGTFEEMVSNVFGYDDLGKFGLKWLVKNFLVIGVENRSDIEIDFTRNVHNNKLDCSSNYVTEEELDIYRVYHPYMWKRKLTPDVVDLFDIGYDSKTQCITFPIKDEMGNCLFIARRSVNTKFFNYPEDVEKPVYGIYELNKICNIATTEIIICESMLDALTCIAYGKYAVALNGTGTPQQYEQLKKLPNRKYILALDPDTAGNRGRVKLRKALTNKIISEYIIPVGKDINNLTEEEFNQLEEILA